MSFSSVWENASDKVLGIDEWAIIIISQTRSW